MGSDSLEQAASSVWIYPLIGFVVPYAQYSFTAGNETDEETRAPAEPMECDVSENVSVRSLRILRFLLFISRSNGDGKCYNAKVETKDPYTNR